MTPTNPATNHATELPLADPLPVVDLLSDRLRAPDYRQWRTLVQATGGCAAPIHLSGSSQILDRDGAVLVEHAGTVLAPCGNRRAAICPACSDRYAADAYHLLRTEEAEAPAALFTNPEYGWVTPPRDRTV